MEWLWLVAAAVVLLALGLWLSWTAHRLDRMHHRLEVARGSLETQLLRRSGAALELATSGALDPARSLLLVDASHHARSVREGPGETQWETRWETRWETQWEAEWEAAESNLSQTLRAVFADADEVRTLRSSPEVGPLLEELTACCRKVELARRFHNDIVSSARALRSRRRVRWLRLAGRAGEPVTVDLDDVPPPVLLAD